MRKTTIGFFTPNLRFDLKVESELYRGILSVVKEKNANLITIIGNIIENIEEYEKSDNLAYDHARNGQVDGIIIWGSNLLRNISTDDQKIFFNKFKDIPKINIAHIFAGIPSVLVDNSDGINQILTHLYTDHGVSKFVFINGPENHLYAKERLQAFIRFCEKNNLVYENRISSSYPFSFQGGANALRDLLDYRNLKVGKDIEAIICSSDSMAAGVIIELISRGIKVPLDVYVTGFDNNERAKASLVPLTTVDTHFYQLGRKAAELLFLLLAGEKIPEVTYSEVKLIKRESCGCIEFDKTVLKKEEKLILLEKTNLIEQSLKRKEREFLNQIESLLGGDIFSVLSCNSLIKLYFSFIDAIFNESNNDFLLNLILLINETKENFFSVYFWQDIISIIRNIVLSELRDQEKISRMDYLLHLARIQIHRIETHISEMKNVETRELITTLSSISSKILTTFDFDELLNKIEEVLAELKISGCYIALYENNKKPFETSRLVFGLTKNLLVYKNSIGYSFDTKELIPKEFVKLSEFKNIVLLSLSFKNNPMGYIIFDVDMPTESHWTIIKDYLSNAIQGCKIRKELEDAYVTKERLLKEFEEQNIRLQDLINEKIKEIESYKKSNLI